MKFLKIEAHTFRLDTSTLQYVTIFEVEVFSSEISSVIYDDNVAAVSTARHRFPIHAVLAVEQARSSVYGARNHSSLMEVLP